MSDRDQRPSMVLLDADTLGPDIDPGPLEEVGALRKFARTDRSTVAERLRGAAIVIANKIVLDDTALETAIPTLRLIALTATGTNNVDLDVCRRHGIAVANVAEYSTESVAQSTLAFVLQLAGRLPYYQRYVATGRYTQSPIFTHYGPTWYELSGKRWGIVGMGAIGRRVAELAAAFGCEVCYHSTSGGNTEQPYPCLDLGALVRSSDVITVHAPLNERTLNLIGRNEFGLMKETAIVVNMGRGGIIDEDALAEAVESRRIGGAATDVYTNEPMRADSPLVRILGDDRFIATPHSAWLSTEARARLIGEVAANIRSFLDGGRRNRVD